MSALPRRAFAVVVALAITGCLLTVGCASPDVTATMADNGGRMTVEAGDILDVVLPDNFPPGGSLWRDRSRATRDDERVLAKLGSKLNPNDVLAGQSAPGIFTGRYEARGPGTVHLTLHAEDESLRPAKILATFDLDVTVRG
jgi:hypothetical protein